MEGFDKRWARNLERDIRRNAREEWRRNRPVGRCRSATGGFVFGIVIIVAGTLMLLDNLGVLHARDIWDYAPLVLVAIGLARIVEGGPTPGLIFGGILTTGGTLWFLHNIDVLRIDPRYVWPVVLIGLGVMFLARAIDQQWRSPVPPAPALDAEASEAAGGTAAPPSAAQPQAQVNIATLFGGVKRYVDSPDFRSADLFACFGGIDIDFRSAKIQQHAVIDANAVFGGIDIKVPRNWFVEIRGTGLFGGYEDKTLHPDESAGPAPRLTITGIAAFGGVSVSSV